jgi:prepilin-type N-terminal cleavage/methylation domain-containing protein
MTKNLSHLPLPPAVRGRRPPGFTLIEMLVVIAVIAILASLIFPVSAAVQRARVRSAARAQLAQVETAITMYKSKLGYYPPDNPIRVADGTTNYALNQLYYELVGTVLTSTVYRTLNGATTITNGNFPTAFSALGTFANTTQNANSDDVSSAANFMKTMKAGQFLLAINSLPNGLNGPVMVLGTTLKGPLMYTDSSGNSINPWFYNSSNPTNNTASFDLWTDVLIGGRTNRICNWSPRPIIL